MEIALKAKKEHPGQRVVLLGNLVHNEIAVADLKKAGLEIIDERKTAPLDGLLSLNAKDVVVFSAHGHPEVYDDLAKAKGLVLIDATCPFVKENTKEGQNSEEPIIYIGVPGHLECEAFLANCPDAAFYDIEKKEFPYLRIKGKKKAPRIIAQTTLSLEEVESAKADILSLLPNAIMGKERCFATRERQKVVGELRKEDVDVLIVLGSATSNNSKKLYEIAKNNGLPCFLCLDKDEVAKLDLSAYKKAALISGASTAESTCLEVEAYLKSL